jgi:hypothetical protein
LKKKAKNGQALVESVLFFFPLMLLSFMAFMNLHDEVQADMQNVRVLRMSLLHRRGAGPHETHSLEEKLVKYRTGERHRDKLPSSSQRRGNLYKNKFPSADKLKIDEFQEMAEPVLKHLYASLTVTMTFDFKPKNKLFDTFYNKEKSYSASVLVPGTMRKRGREIALILGVAGMFYK